MRALACTSTILLLAQHSIAHALHSEGRRWRGKLFIRDMIHTIMYIQYCVSIDGRVVLLYYMYPWLRQRFQDIDLLKKQFVLQTNTGNSYHNFIVHV